MYIFTALYFFVGKELNQLGSGFESGSGIGSGINYGSGS
jgi:hypothetical protein